MIGTEVKYWNDVQIVHELSKRFLCIEKIDSSETLKYYDSKKFLDTNIFKLGFSYTVNK